jgi:hypothetical protein
MSSDTNKILLHAQLADIEGEIAKIKDDSRFTPGQKYTLAQYWHHEREKKLAELQLDALSHEVEACRAQHEYSKTPGAQKQWKAHEQRVLAGRALGRPPRSNTSCAKGPEEEAYRRLQQAELKYKEEQNRFDALRAKDSEFREALDALVVKANSPKNMNRQSSEFESVVVPEPVNEFVKDAIGFDYISVILRTENRPISALQLQCSAGGNVKSQFTENTLDSLRAENGDDDREFDVGSNLRQQDFAPDPILDDLGRKKLQNSLSDLEKQTTAAVEAGDMKRAKELQDEYDQINRQLEISRNLYRRPRTFNSKNEKARLSITQALTRAYRKIREHLPELAHHLESSIARGSVFWYRDTTIKWKL